ncbi:MAG: arginine--tRNA ligase [Planctomycetota bacterium]|nr:MAG: arginine--tRNA ligase [Planctomycetota bacterium]
MNLLASLRRAIRDILAARIDDPAVVDELVGTIRPSTDPKFGDYQANCAMPLGKRLGKPPREIAAELVAAVVARPEIVAMCEPPEIAGPGFINLRLRDEWLAAEVNRAARDEERLGVGIASPAKTYVVDYSGPNVAKPMHVGHIRSTVIGDALWRTLKFLGHNAIGDNHVGDWGTQFGMIIYGWKHFRDEAAYKANAVEELARLYRLTRQLIDYWDAATALPKATDRLVEIKTRLLTIQTESENDKIAAKKTSAELKRLGAELDDIAAVMATLQSKLDAVHNNARLSVLAVDHAAINDAVLSETAKLHAGDPENLALWREFLPPCMSDIETIYRRLGVKIDYTLGESFYHDRLAGIVELLARKNLVRESDGAKCVFLDGFDFPMIVQKRDGAFLYSTTDLATIDYREKTWRPDAILYVVDHRQSGHFAQLFAATRLADLTDAELAHVSFGTVLGDDGKPFKTRSGDTVGLGGLLDEAERRALAIVSENDDAKPQPELSAEERANVARIVGIAAIKYADLAHNRTSDYVFSYDKMLATKGNTATYMQYAYARVRSIFRKGDVDIDALRREAAAEIVFTHPSERALAIGLLSLEEALDSMLAGYYPHHLTTYLFDVATRYSTFYQECDVLKAEPESTRTSRLLLCDLTARTLKLGLGLLGIETVEKM